MAPTLGFGTVAQEFAPYGKVWCRDHYWYLRMEENGAPSAFVVFGAIGTIVLTLLLGNVTHIGWKSEDVKSNGTGEESDVELLPTYTSTSTPVETGRPPQKQARQALTWCPTNVPEPRLRATRFALGVIIYAGILALFVARIVSALDRPYVPDICKKDIGLKGPDWVAIGILNCVPFAIASFAILRAFVDCVLVRWNKHLGYGRKTDGNAIPWPPCMPLVVIFVAVAGSFYLLFECVRIPAALVMGRSEASMWTERFAGGLRSAVEARKEEELGLVQNVDGGDDGKEDGGAEPPPYEELVEEPVEMKKGGEWGGRRMGRNFRRNSR
jgi:hypothetical protein